jgi:putative flippase GtrA
MQNPIGTHILHLVDAHPAARHGTKLFVRNSVASVVAFAVDLALLWLLVQEAHVNDLVAVSVAFLLAMTLHYVLARVWVFRGTDRGVASGYAYFIINAAIGLTVTLVLFAVMTRLTGLHFLASRAVASAVAGIVVFFLNAVFNFRQL